jgi:hypothetical protein
MPPALKEAVVAQVDGFNKARAPGDPELTVNGFVCSVLWGLFEVARIEENTNGAVRKIKVGKRTYERRVQSGKASGVKVKK